ncbi:MAG: hypothetical protein ACRDTJ_33095, partial [Pseudonocardiaceae bacterium]
MVYQLHALDGRGYSQQVVQRRTHQTPGPILSGLGLLTGLAATGIGAGLVVRNHETLFGAVWSALML